ncbi:MAG: hypothetical protein WC797_01015, partial [Candidatus Paceibacterota bacterium]
MTTKRSYVYALFAIVVIFASLFFYKFYISGGALETPAFDSAQTKTGEDVAAEGKTSIPSVS